MTTLTANVYSLGYKSGILIRSSISSIHKILQNSDKLSITEVAWYVAKFPSRYKRWWIELLNDDPLHVFIETILLAFVFYMLVSKRWNNKDWQKRSGEVILSEKEKEDLVREWKPAPLAPDISNDETKEKNAVEPIIIKKVQGCEVELQNKKGTFVNLATHDFLGIGCSQPSLKQVSKEAMKVYGVGSCGPRGFYGTSDLHLQLEEQFSLFCKADSSILYSDGASAVTSAVAAFAKRGDLLVVDEGVYEPLQTGVTLSRANVLFYKHNDMHDLRRVLEQVQENDIKIGRKPSDQRRFIVAEALYKHFGHITPLDQLIQLKNEFAYRLILDESFSFGALGQHGRGVVELYNKSIMKDVEIVTISLENSMASIGGLCVGSMEVVDHQRLSGAGYCFSASAPPFLAASAIQSLTCMKEMPHLFQALHKNIFALREAIAASIPQLIITSDTLSPMLYLRLSSFKDYSISEETYIYNQIVQQCLNQGVILVSAVNYNRTHFKLLPPPSIRINVSSVLDSNHITIVINALQHALQIIS